MNIFFFIISCIRFIPHILLFYLFPNRIRPDLTRWIEVIDGNPYANHPLLAYLWLLDHLPEYRTLLYHRFGRLGLVLRLFASPRTNCFLTGMLSCNIGPGLVIQHGHSMRLGAQRVGRNLQIWHNVTVGKDRPGGTRPIIGDNVRIYTGSVVVGAITIGDNVTIGACTLVIKSVPSNCVVVGNPAYIIKRDGKPCKEKL